MAGGRGFSAEWAQAQTLHRVFLQTIINGALYMEAIDWNYAIATLVIRFVGIFIVLGILQVVMQISGRIFVRMGLGEKEKKGATPRGSQAPAMTEDQAAAVGMALYLYDKTK
mgnify:CR=1 FL=1